MAIVEPAETGGGSSFWQDAWHRLWQNKLAIFGLVVLCVLAALCFASFLWPNITGYSYEQQNLALGPAPPNHVHWLGTDPLGRDLLARLLYGGGISLMVGLCATAVSLTIGVIYGAIAGFAGGKLDMLMMRSVDILYALPFAIFVILLTVFFGQNIILLFVAIGAVEWLTMARIVRGQVMSVKRQEFVEAAHALGLKEGTNHFPAHRPQFAGADYCLCHADRAGSDFAGVLFKLPRPGRATAAQFLGRAHQRRR